MTVVLNYGESDDEEDTLFEFAYVNDHFVFVGPYTFAYTYGEEEAFADALVRQLPEEALAAVKARLQ